LNPNQGATWFRLLPSELNGIQDEDYWDPEIECDTRTDNLVGVMSDVLKQLFTLYRRLDELAARTKLDARYSRNIDDAKQNAFRAIEFKTKADALSEILWISIRDEFNLWDKPSIGLRRGFKVVWEDIPEPPNIRDILRDIFGG